MPPVLRKVMIGVLAVLIVLTSGIIIRDFVGNHRSQQLWQDMREIYTSTTDAETAPEPTLAPVATTPEITTTTAMETTTEPTLNERFEPLLEVNPDIVGWITIDDTPIDYPVVQAEDNVYYLDHDIYGENSQSGSLFLDYRIGDMQEDPHLIIYGHNMRSGAMFHSLMEYKKEPFFLEHQIFTFDQLFREDSWEIFSVYVTKTDFYYIQTDFPTDEEHLSFIDQITERSMYDTGIQVNVHDQILTLSTCTYEYDDARFVIHARRINPLTKKVNPVQDKIS